MNDGTTPVKYTLSADDEKLLKSVDASENAFKRATTSAKEYAAAIGQAEKAASSLGRVMQFHGAAGRSTIAGQLVGSANPESLRVRRDLEESTAVRGG